jgi:hypothetical protein
MAFEEDQREKPRIVEDTDPPGKAWPRRGLMGLDGDGQGLGGAVHKARDLAVSPDYQILGQEKQNIAHPGPSQTLQERAHARADALERGDGGEERKQTLGSHVAVA